MSDLISRQAAIDYLVLNMGWHDEDGYPVDDADEKRGIITELLSGIPSAEPKQGEWIPLKDRFPKFDEYVLVTVFGNLEIGYFDKDPDNMQIRFMTEEYSLYEDDMYENVDAWMPLPKPYRGDGNE